MVIDCCPHCAAEGLLKNCKVSGKNSIRFQNYDYWREFFTTSKEPYVISCAKCGRTYFVTYGSLIFTFLLVLLLAPLPLYYSINRGSITLAFLVELIWILSLIFIPRISFLFPWKEISKADYPKHKRRYLFLYYGLIVISLAAFVTLTVILG